MSNHPHPQSVPPAAWRLWHALGQLRFVGQSGIVVGGVAIVWLLMAPVAYELAGSDGLIAAGIAAGVSLLAAEFALAIAWAFRGPAAPMYGMAAGGFVRMSVAVLTGVALQRGVPMLADAAVIVYLLVFYLVTLALETALLLAATRPAAVPSGAPVA